MSTSPARKRVYFAMDRFEDRINELWGELYLPSWIHGIACRIWGHAPMNDPGDDFCAYCQKDLP